MNPEVTDILGKYKYADTDQAVTSGADVSFNIQVSMGYAGAESWPISSLLMWLDLSGRESCIAASSYTAEKGQLPDCTAVSGKRAEVNSCLK